MSVGFIMSYCPDCMSSSILVMNGYQQCEICDAKYELNRGTAASIMVNLNGDTRYINQAGNLAKVASLFIEDPSEEVWTVKPDMIGQLTEWVFNLDQNTLAEAWKISAGKN